MKNRKANKKVYVAMSGGVDSSVAAALLKKEGYFVVGVFFKPWAPHPTINYSLPTTNFCTWQQDRRDAMRVCAKLGIPFKTWDFSKEYEKEVVQYMIKAYKSGITPNPDVVCNKEIKFGLFLKKALAEGADYIATGHYARLKTVISNSKLIIRNSNYQLPTTNYRLLVAKDPNKDQSYFLWTLTQKQLKHCLFPIGEYTKPEVRELAKKFGLPNWNKKDSQGVCFVGPLNMKEFLKSFIKPKTGKIILADSGKVIGKHDGIYYYTVGQRHGLDIKDGGGPYYVVGKNISRNILYVAKAIEKNSTTKNKMTIKKAYALFVVMSKSIEIGNIGWVREKPKLPLNCEIKIRYRSESIPAVITKPNHLVKQGLPSLNPVLVKFKKPARAVTPGQSAVFYRGEEVLGGGVIM